MADPVADASLEASAGLRLREERDRFLAFAFCMADTLIELDRDGVIAFAAGAAQDFFGRPAEQLVGQRLIECIAEAYRPGFEKCLSMAATGERFDAVPVRFTRPDGGEAGAALTGFRLAEMGERCYVAVRHRRIEAARRRALDADAPAAAPQGDDAEEIEALRAKLSEIIAERRFEIAFQPVVRLNDGRVHHVEALLRPDREQLDLAPADFIRAAERCGVIADLDAAMIEKVIGRLRDVGEKGAPVPVAVNLSGHSIDRPDFMANLEALLRGERTLTSLLMFEITNSAQIRDLVAADGAIQDLRFRGFKVSLDDFGTGGAAFEQLRAIEVDFVKIDGSYIEAALNDAKGRAFVTAMANLCRELGTATIAEQVEDQDSVAFLRGCGIEYGQGYLFGRPMQNVDLLTGRTMDAQRWRRRTDGESLL